MPIIIIKEFVKELFWHYDATVITLLIAFDTEFDMFFASVCAYD